jgi:hypothetical protein
MAEPEPPELAADLIAWARGEPYAEGEEPPVWRWERWIRDDPERAWEVFLALVSRAADELEVMERVAQRLPQLLHRHWAAFHARALRLVRSTPLLDPMIGPETFTEGHYGPRYRNLDELASVWVRHDAVAEGSHRVRDIIRTEPEAGLRLALEIIRRGPRYGIDEWELGSPLLDVLRCHGPAVIADVEAEAAGSEPLRRVIWESRRQNPTPDEPHSIGSEVWSRLMRAAGATTTYNSPRPAGVRTPLPYDEELLLDRWIEAERTFWAWVEVGDLVREDPERGWDAILALARHADAEKAQCDIGCGPLEDLIRSHPAEMVERIEHAAANDARCRLALGCVWITLEDVPDELARRYWKASGGDLAVLDAPPGWASGHN